MGSDPDLSTPEGTAAANEAVAAALGTCAWTVNNYLSDDPARNREMRNALLCGYCGYVAICCRRDRVEVVWCATGQRVEHYGASGPTEAVALVRALFASGAATLEEGTAADG